MTLERPRLQREDDSSIPDEEKLWRRIPKSQIVPGDDGKPRPSSAAFRDRETGEISVHLSSLTTKEAALERFPEFSLAEIPAGLPRSLGYSVARDPIKDDSILPDDPSHALVCPPPSRSLNRCRKDHSVMAVQSQWAVLREGHSPNSS